MKKIKIVTDSTAYFTRQEAEREKISIVPLSYSLGDRSMKEAFPGEFEEVFEIIQEGKLFISTSQPALGDFIEVYEEAFREGYDEIIVLVLSSKLSGCFNSANLAKDVLGDKMITVIDSKTSAGNLKFLVQDAIKMIKMGKTSQEIREFIEAKSEKIEVYLSVDSLEYLERSGRISRLASLVGNVLKIKPIIRLKNGELDMFEKLRGRKQLINRLIALIDPSIEKISISHILAYEDSLKIKEEIEKNYQTIEVSIDELGPVIGGHLGPGSIGLCLY